MIKIIQQLSRGGIGKQFVYLPNLAVYPNSSDMNGLGVIGGNGLIEKMKKFLKQYRINHHMKK